MSAERVIAIAQSQIGYLEKASNSNLDSMTGNAGSNNYNKYARDIWPAFQAQPWCDIFVSWCAEKAGESAAVGRFAYCPTHVNWFKSRGQWYARGAVTPIPGDIIFFQSNGSAAHVGIVEFVGGGYVHTIEGNASGTSGLTPNGGGVVRKSYPLGSAYIMGYGRPAYTSADKTEAYYYPWRSYRNGSTEEPVYKDTDRTVKTGSLNPGEKCYCAGRYGDSYLVCYKVDGTADNWAVGYVGYHGGVS